MPGLTDKRPDKPQSHDRLMTGRGKDGLALGISAHGRGQARLTHQYVAAPASNFFGNDNTPPTYSAHRHDSGLDQAAVATPLRLDQTGQRLFFF